MKAVERVGLTLAYEETGIGDPPLLFVHGCSGNHSQLALQMEHFRARHRVIAPDLRGHAMIERFLRVV